MDIPNLSSTTAASVRQPLTQVGGEEAGAAPRRRLHPLVLVTTSETTAECLRPSQENDLAEI